MKRAVMQGSKLFVVEVRMDYDGNLSEEESDNLNVFTEERSAVVYFHEMADLQEFLEEAHECEIVEV